jgi:hypothetical protein
MTIIIHARPVARKLPEGVQKATARQLSTAGADAPGR